MSFTQDNSDDLLGSVNSLSLEAATTRKKEINSLPILDFKKSGQLQLEQQLLTNRIIQIQIENEINAGLEQITPQLFEDTGIKPSQQNNTLRNLLLAGGVILLL